MEHIPREAIGHLMVRGNAPHRHALMSGMKAHLSGKTQPQLEGTLGPVVEVYSRDRKRLGELTIRDIDVPFLIQNDLEQAIAYLDLLLRTSRGEAGAAAKIELKILSYIEEREPYHRSFPDEGDDYVIPCTSSGDHPEELISNKGATLLSLSRGGYPIPDFVILSSVLYRLPDSARRRHVQRAIDILEWLTIQQMGSAETPLIFAFRCAMPCYMPGIMPTYLNVGVTESTIPALVRHYGEEPAYKMFLNNIKNILLARDPEGYELVFGSGWIPEERLDVQVARAVRRVKGIDPLLVQDPYRQTAFFLDQAFKYYENNLDLMLTFSRGEEHFPSLILQRMICTVRDERSRVGVIFSRHPRTGIGGQIESGRRIFGEQIMAGAVETEKVDFVDKQYIKEDYPAVYRFIPTLYHLEAQFQSPVTIEFATDVTDQYEFFNLLQLNASEITGRSAFISVMDMYNRGTIGKERVPELIRPYHLKQIESDAIDPDSFKDLTLFSSAASVLPRTAVLARMFFSAESALRHKKAGQKVCLCKATFEPNDTVVMGEVDAIVSLTSAAIHVITICQSFGLPALLDLEKHGVRMIEQGGRRLVNETGIEIKEGEWVTISSRKRCLYKGKVRFKPARLIRYMKGDSVTLEPPEVIVFEQMSCAYRAYNQLVADLRLGEVLSLAEIIRLVALEFRGEREKAADLVNSWFDRNTELYVEGVFKSDMGDHLQQNTAFSLLSLERKICFFRLALDQCRRDQRMGFSAGMFMLGRFISMPQPVELWASLKSVEIMLLVNEWLLFEKYMQILHEVGERRIRKAKHKILQEGLSPLRLTHARIKPLIPLKLSRKRLGYLRRRIPDWCDPQTRDVLELLQAPYSSFYDFNQAWSLNELKRLCEENGLPLPDSGSSGPP